MSTTAGAGTPLHACERSPWSRPSPPSRHAHARTLDGRPFPVRVVLVSNNRYELDALSLGERRRIDEGSLYLYVATGLLPGRWEGRGRFRSWRSTGRGATIQAAVDGKPVELELPARFALEAKALRVLLPQSVATSSS